MKAGGLAGVECEGADEAVALNIFDEEGVHVARGLAHVFPEFAAGAEMHAAQPEQQRQRGDGERGKQRVLPEEQGANAENGEQADGALLGAVEHDAFDVLDVLGHARGDLSGLALVVVGDRQHEQLGVQRSAQVEQHLLLKLVVYANAEGVEGIAQKIAASEHGDADEQQITTSERDDVVDDPLNHARNRDEEQRAADRQRKSKRKETRITK